MLWTFSADFPLTVITKTRCHRRDVGGTGWDRTQFVLITFDRTIIRTGSDCNRQAGQQEGATLPSILHLCQESSLQHLCGPLIPIIERCTPRLPGAKTTSSPRLLLWWTATASDGQERFFYHNVEYVEIIKWAGIKLLVHPRRIAQCILILTCWGPLFSGYSWAEPTLGLEDILRQSYDRVISKVLKCFTKLRTEF